MNDLSKLPTWLLILGVFFLAGILSYAVATGRQVSFWGVEIGGKGEQSSGGSQEAMQIELWTIEGTLALKSYTDLKPDLRDHLHELLLRVKPPVFEVEADGKFRIKNVPVHIDKGSREEPLIEVYPIKDILSQGYRAETIRISQQSGSYGSESPYTMIFNETTKTVTITSKVALKNPNKESLAPVYSTATAIVPTGINP